MSIRKIKKCEKNIVALFCCSFFTAPKLLFLQFFSCFCIPFSAAVIYVSFIAFHTCILHFAPFPRPAVAFSALPAPAPPCPLAMLLISSIINTVLRLPLFPHSFFGGWFLKSMFYVNKQHLPKLWAARKGKICWNTFYMPFCLLT